MVVPISPSSEKSPPAPSAPSAPQLSPTHDPQPFGQLSIGFVGNELYLVDENVWRHQHLANLIRRRQDAIRDNVLWLNDIKKSGFEIYISYLDYGSIKLCSLEDALLSMETAELVTCSGLSDIAISFIDEHLNSSNLMMVLKVIAPIVKGKVRSVAGLEKPENYEMEEAIYIKNYLLALRDNCRDVSKSCCKEILFSEEFSKLSFDEAREIFGILDLSSIESGRTVITEGEFLMGPAKYLPKVQAEELHKLMKIRKVKLIANESRNHVYHLSSRTVHGCPVSCSSEHCTKNKASKLSSHKVDVSKREGKIKFQRAGFWLCRCWQTMFD